MTLSHRSGGKCFILICSDDRWKQDTEKAAHAVVDAIPCTPSEEFSRFVWSAGPFVS